MPARVVSLAPSLTKSLYYLGAEENLVGHTTFCHIAMDDNKSVVATVVKVNLEKVITLRPELVVATTITNPETIAMLRKAGLNVEVFSTPRTFEEICSQFLRLGRLVGKEARALEITNATRSQVLAIKDKNKRESPLRFFFQIGANPLFTVLENTFMNDYITFLGGQNIASGLTRGTISREFVLVNKPEVIVVVTMGIVGDEEVRTWQQYPSLPAVRQNRLFIIESDMASTPTPPDFLKTLEILSGYLEKTL